MHLTQLLMISQSRLIKIVAGVLSLLCVVGCDFAKMKKCPSYVATYIDIQGLKLETTSDKMSVEVNPSQGLATNMISWQKILNLPINMKVCVVSTTIFHIIRK